MYRIIYFLFLPLFIASCGGSASTGDVGKSDSLAVDSNILMIGNVRFEISPSSKEEFEKYPSALLSDTGEAQCISLDSTRVRRSHDSLIFKTSAKEVILINDSTEEYDSWRIYILRNNLQSIKYWDIRIGMYEGAYNVLLSQNTGDTITTIGDALISKNNNYVICAHEDLYAGFDINGIELFENEKGILRRIGIAELDWGPTEIKWISNDQLLIKRLIPSYKNKDDKEKTDYIKLTVK